MDINILLSKSKCLKIFNKYDFNYDKDIFNKSKEELFNHLCEIPNINYNIPNVSSYSDPMKKLQTDAQMVGGRIKKSQLEFLSPFVNRAQIFRQYGGKWNTKKQIWI